MSNTGENLRGRVALRLFDGIPQGSPLREGTRNGTFTDMGVVGRIEVINGPSASEGIGAAGGIINYISKTPTRQGNETTVTTRYGRSSTTTAPAGRSAAPSRTSRTPSTCCSRRRTSIAASPMTATAAASV